MTSLPPLPTLAPLTDQSANFQIPNSAYPKAGEEDSDLKVRLRLAGQCIEEYRRTTAEYQEAYDSSQEVMKLAEDSLYKCVYRIESLNHEVTRLKNERTLLGLLGDSVTYATESIFFFLWGVCVASVKSARNLPPRVKHIVTTAVIIGISFVVRLWDRISRIYTTTLRIGGNLATRISIRLFTRAPSDMSPSWEYGHRPSSPRSKQLPQPVFG